MRLPRRSRVGHPYPLYGTEAKETPGVPKPGFLPRGAPYASARCARARAREITEEFPPTASLGGPHVATMSPISAVDIESRPVAAAEVSAKAQRLGSRRGRSTRI